MLTIRRAEESDFDSIWQIFHQVVENGDAYTYDPTTTKEQAHSIWMSDATTTYVACMNGKVVGTYILRPNQVGRGSHVANAAYMVRADCSSQGIGTAMCEHSLEEAQKAGFSAMQFNMVVSVNVAAVVLWKKMGFSIVGTLPKVFRHEKYGLVDAYVMHRFL